MTALATELSADDLDEFTGAAREGTLRWRDETVRFFRSRGLPAGRPLLPPHGAWTDRGEIDGLPGWLLIARRQKSLKLPQCIDAAADLARKAESRFHGVVIYRRQCPTQAAYVLLSLGTFAELLRTIPAEGDAR